MRNKLAVDPISIGSAFFVNLCPLWGGWTTTKMPIPTNALFLTVFRNVTTAFVHVFRIVTFS